MRVHLINPSDKSFGIGVIAPRWLYVLAAATPAKYGDPILCDETLERFNPNCIEPGDVVGLGIHTSNALRGLELGRIARERGAYVVFGGVHASLFPEEALELGGAHAVVKGDGDIVWAKAIEDLLAGTGHILYDGGRLSGEDFLAARWDLAPREKYMWASVQTVRGCPKHCSFCSVWRTDGQKPRPRTSDTVLAEIVDLRRRGFRFIALADDNFYPVSLEDLRLASKQGNHARVQELQEIRKERFELMQKLSKLPKDMVFFTQITMEAGEDVEFLRAMYKAHIRGALVGVESATPEGLKSVFKDFNLSGDNLAERLQTFSRHGINILGSFIFGLPTDRAETFRTTAKIARRTGIALAQFVLLTPLPGTIDFARWEKSLGKDAPKVDGVPITRYWLIPVDRRPNVLTSHPIMSAEEIRKRTQAVWDSFYSLPAIWERSRIAPNLRSRIAFLFISKLYRQMYAKTGIATDSARREKATRMARWLAVPCRKLFEAKPMPELEMPVTSQSAAAKLPVHRAASVEASTFHAAS